MPRKPAVWLCTVFGSFAKRAASSLSAVAAAQLFLPVTPLRTNLPPTAKSLCAGVALNLT